MALIVQKFGGTSVGDVQKIKRVAERVARTRDGGKNNVVVVVSAMGHSTDELVDLAHKITKRPAAREFDMLLSVGEQVSIALVTMALHELGVDAVSMTGGQSRILTDGTFTKAKIRSIDGSAIQAHLDKGRVVVVAGFQGITDENEITTLGRGGSDTTAVALAAALNADVCEIFTDVEGVFTADPRVVPTARKLPRISYDEMLELASLGAQVLQSRSVEFGKRYNVKIHVRSTFSEQEGTIVMKEVPEMERMIVTGVSSNAEEAKMTIMGVPNRPGVAAQICSSLANANINIDMIVQSEGEGNTRNMSFTVPKAEVEKARDICEKVASELGATKVEADEKIAKVSIVGVGMRGHTGVAAKMFKTLADNNINIAMISTSEIKISVVIPEQHVKKAVRAIHEVFNLDKVEFPEIEK